MGPPAPRSPAGHFAETILLLVPVRVPCPPVRRLEVVYTSHNNSARSVSAHLRHPGHGPIAVRAFHPADRPFSFGAPLLQQHHQPWVAQTSKHHGIKKASKPPSRRRWWGRRSGECFVVSAYLHKQMLLRCSAAPMQLNAMLFPSVLFVFWLCRQSYERLGIYRPQQQQEMLQQLSSILMLDSRTNNFPYLRVMCQVAVHTAPPICLIYSHVVQLLCFLSRK